MPFGALGARLLLLLCLLGAWASVSGQERNMAAREAQAAPRVALVVGNGAYAEAPLRNALNDARGMVAALQGMGFEVQLLENGDLQQMDQAVREFGRRLRSAKVGLFYYAGHALQIRGRNYLIPLGARFEQEDEVAYRSLDVGQVLDKMDSARTPTNLMILDACRTNPFQKYFRASRHGLAEMEAPPGTLIAFATAPGAVASDGDGDHGVYTRHLLRQIETRGLPVEQVFKRVRVGVSADTQDKQIPWESSSLREDFQFRPSPLPAAPVVSEAALDLAFWDAVKNSPRGDDFAAYMEQFPRGRFVTLARSRLAELRAATKPALAPSAPLPAAPAQAVPVAAASKPPAAPPAAPQAVAPAETAPAGWRYRLPAANYTALAFAADDSWLAVGDGAGRVSFFDVASGTARGGFTLDQPLSALRAAADGRHLALATEHGEIRLFDRLAGRELWRRRAHEEKVLSLAFSPDGRYLLSAAARGSAQLSAVADGASVQSLPAEDLPLLQAVYSPEGRHLGLVLGEGQRQVVKVIEVGSGRLRLATAATAASFSVNGRYLLVAAGGHTPTLFDIASGEALKRFARFDTAIMAGAYAENGRHVVTLDAAGKALLLDTAEGRPVATLQTVAPRAVAFSTDARRLAVLDGEGRVAVYQFQEKP